MTLAVEFLDRDLTACSDDQLLAHWRELERLRNELAVHEYAVIAEAEQRNLAYHRACANTAALLRDVLRVHPREAAARVRAAAAAGPRSTVQGEPLDPVFPSVAAAQARGDISARHAQVITDCIDKLPGTVAAEHGEQVEVTLVAEALDFDPAALAMLARRITDHLNPDGRYTEPADQQRRRDLIVRQDVTGAAALVAELTPECSEKFLTVLDTLARPATEADGTKDPRTPGQRRHDALLDLCDLVLRSGQLPDCGGVSTTVIVTMSDEAWRTGKGVATTGHGAVMTAGQAIELAGGDVRLLCVATNSMREITGYGHAHRLFSENQRLAMTVRDGGCSFPGCTVPPAWCQSQHIIDYADGGPTSVAYGTLLCGFHHREFQNLGWTCQMSDGQPTWLPPPWIDPNQRPRTNPAHHLVESLLPRGT